ncbi:translocation/assembly module TamB domain-containing protein [Ideonella sp. BN130291]|uniref:translocation/assembly module TamB domain-containing protein n=1 Tax=Ideonella sp. BN130291 TaxID=3112940 RepID=UPI002E260446|nr:translocation/assembly module TamB domain-containing protein [Ideonella sp. BN130291]
MNDTTPAPAAPAVRAPHRLRRLLVVLLGLLLALAAVLIGAGAWLWHSEDAAVRLLQQVPGLQLSGQHGRLTGGGFRADRLEWRAASGLRVVVDGLSWADAQWRFRPHPGAWVGLTLVQPRAHSVRVVTAPKTQPSEPLQAPEHLRLPLELLAQNLQVDALQVDEQAPITGLRLSLHAGADQGASHRVDGLVLMRGPLALSGQARIGADGSLPVDARLRLATAPDAAQPWQAALRLEGPLRQLNASATLKTAKGPGATVQASLTPFADWPLAALRATTDDLDLSAFGAGLPETRLSGNAVMGDGGNAQAMSLELALANAVPGPWDAHRLPVRQLHVVLKGRPQDLGSLHFDALQAELGGERPAGQLQGGGRWQGSELSVQLRLVGVQPQLLHTAAAPMTLEGPVQLALQGLPSPAAPAAAASAPAGTPAAAGKRAAPTPLRGEVRTELTGRLPARDAPPLGLVAVGSFTLPGDGSLQLALREATARAGDARAVASANADKGTDGAWHLRTQGELVRFDPALWLPMPRATRANALNGSWRADLMLPAVPADDLLAALRGDAGLTLRDSQFAGLPLQGEASLQARPETLKLAAQLRAASNRLQLDGGTHNGTHDWRLDVQAPALGALAPLQALVPGAAGWMPQGGTLQANATARGRWPALQTEGTLQVAQLRSPALQVAQAQARWTFSGTQPDAPLSLDASATGIAQAQRRLERLQVRLAGTLRSHSFTVQAASPLRPPEWTEALAGRSAPGGSQLQLDGGGQWQPAAPGGGTWRGTVARLQAAPRTAPGQPWLAASDIQASVRLAASGQPDQASLAPGRIALFGGAVRWQQAQWQAPARAQGLPRIALDARIEPLQVAPWLARLQPQFGWRGDLALGGRVQLHTGERVDADVVVERAGPGDLSLTVEGATRSLGLSDLRVAVAAHGGQWNLTQLMAGRNVGVLHGSQTLRTSATALTPTPDSALAGQIALQVPDLSVWAPWLPPGWRLGGELRTEANLSGRAGAPQYRGRISGSQLTVRNLFEGVNLRQGVLAVALNGTDATVERFEFRDGSGEGLLRVTGSASFGDAPRAQLRAVAERFRALDRVDRRVAVSGTANLGMQEKRIALDGRFVVDSGLIDASQADAPQHGEDVIVVNRPGGPLRTAQARKGGRNGAAATTLQSGTQGAVPAPKPAPNSTVAQADVNLQVDLGRALRVRGRGLDALLRGQLAVTTPQGELAVNGVVRVEEGTYTAYGQNLSIDRGNLTFTGDAANPRLDILAIRADVDTRVGVVVTGLVANPRVRLYSEPELPEFDTLTWLVLGRAPEGLGRDDTALLQRAALALLAGDKGSGGGFVKKLGLDELSVKRPESGGDLSGTIVTLGKQVSKRLFVGYERAIAAAGGTWQLIYRVAGRITVRARTGDDNAVDAIWTWRWE